MDTAEQLRARVFTRDDLIARGWRGREITHAVRAGGLVRLRRGWYAFPDVPREIAHAVRVGGRLACLSLLKLLGAFVLAVDRPHVHVGPHASRLRDQGSVVLHWGALTDVDHPHVVTVGMAVAQSVRCQPLRATIATLDSLLHQRIMTIEQLRTVIRQLPARFGVLLRLVDESAESGPETFMRLILRGLGVRFQTQVQIPGVGRVDFLVAGWLIIECDSRQFHEGWAKQQQDRHRDIAAAQQGYVTIRPLAADILRDPASVRTRLADILAAFAPVFPAERVHNSGEPRRNRPGTRRTRPNRPASPEL